VDERTTADGEILRGLDLPDLERARRKLIDEGARSVAVCFLHSYRNPANEAAAAEILRREGDLFVAVSSEVLPEYREYERLVTTVVSAMVTPIMAAYLESLERGLGHPIGVMQSAGGVVPSRTVRREAARTVLSGPAGGVVGGLRAAREAGYADVITFDMGGTSTDVALCPGAPPMTSRILVGDMTLALPGIDIATVGAGGGSVAWVDPGGALRVGPRSAGADPGPVAYGKGEEITVTDANLYLGRIQPGTFLGGEMTLHLDRVEDRVRSLGATLGMPPWRAAEGVIEVARAEMGRALRSVSLARGHDPRDFALVAFGGGGPLHALDLARELGSETVIIPPNPGLVSAMGLLVSDGIAQASRTILGSRGGEEIFRDLEMRTARDLGGPREGDIIQRHLDVRYEGQSYEITVPWGDDFEDRFHETHRALYGVADESRPVEVVHARVTRRRPVSIPSPAPPAGGKASPRPVPALFGGERRKIPLWMRDDFGAGATVAGPALIAEYSSTTYIPPGGRGIVDPTGALILRWGEEGS
jgi:N-methylhydantoinase A